MEIEDYIAAKLAYEKNNNSTQVLKDRLRINNNTLLQHHTIYNQELIVMML